MAQATSSSTTLNDGKNDDHRNQSNIKSDADLPIDPSIAASSPTYPPPYSPYNPQGHDMSQYQGHPPPQMYARPEWSHGYPHQQHAMQGPYSSPAPPTVGSASPATSAGPRPGQVRSFGSGARSISFLVKNERKKKKEKKEKPERIVPVISWGGLCRIY
jgi:transcription factor CON7